MSIVTGSPLRKTIPAGGLNSNDSPLSILTLISLRSTSVTRPFIRNVPGATATEPGGAATTVPGGAATTVDGGAGVTTAVGGEVSTPPGATAPLAGCCTTT